MPRSATFHVNDLAAPTPTLPRRLGVAVVITESDDRVLLEHRSDSDLWGLFGGAVDDHESALEALHREVREETSLALCSHQLLGVFSDPTRIIAYPDGNVLQSVTVAFVGQLEPGVITLSAESRAVDWFTWSTLPWQFVPATQVAILRHAELFLTGQAGPYVD